MLAGVSTEVQIPRDDSLQHHHPRDNCSLVQEERVGRIMLRCGCFQRVPDRIAEAGEALRKNKILAVRQASLYT